MAKFDKQEYAIRKCLDAIEKKKDALKMKSFFNEIHSARMFFYGYIECLKDCEGLKETNVQTLQRHVLETFK